MHKKTMIFGLTLASAIFFYSLIFAAEEITITTYYPSPSGSYKELTVSDRQAIGDVNGDTKVNQDDMAVEQPFGPPVPIPGTLTVSTAIGIGTFTPGFDGTQRRPWSLDIRAQGPGYVRCVSAEVGAGFENYAIYGQAQGSSYAVKGKATEGGYGVYGSSEAGIGVYAKTTTGTALKAEGDVVITNISGGNGIQFVTTDNSGTLYLATPGASSKRYKKDIRDLEIKPGNLFKLRPVKFRWKENNKEDVGLIAEEVNETIKDLVIYDNENKPQSVKYDKVAIYLLGVVKDQQKQINALKTEITELKVTLTKKK